MFKIPTVKLFRSKVFVQVVTLMHCQRKYIFFQHQFEKYPKGIYIYDMFT